MSMFEDRQLKYIKTGIDFVITSAKAILEHFEDAEEKNKYLNEHRQQIIQYLKMEIEYTTGKRVLKNLEQHLEIKEGTMHTDIVADYKKMFEEEMSAKSKELEEESLKKNPKYLELDQLIASEMGNTMEEDADLVCQDEEIHYNDPWSKKKIETPVRNKTCTHVYDKATALKMISRSKGKVKCPVVGCANNNVKSSDLIEDIQIKKILQSQAI